MDSALIHKCQCQVFWTEKFQNFSQECRSFVTMGFVKAVKRKLIKNISYKAAIDLAIVKSVLKDDSAQVWQSKYIKVTYYWLQHLLGHKCEILLKSYL